LGIDDGFFPKDYKKEKGLTVLVGLLYENGKPIRFDLERVTVDGNDCTKAINRIAQKLDPDLILSDSVTCAGFNFISPEDINFPLIIVYNYKPNINSIMNALMKHMKDDRVDIIIKVISNLKEIISKKGKIYAYFSKVSEYDGINYINYNQEYSKIPEPIRGAGVLASAISRWLISY
jgi:Uncharacterized conserved protein